MNGRQLVTGRGVLVWGEDNTAVEEYRHERSGRTGADSRDKSAEVACPSAVDRFIETHRGATVAESCERTVEAGEHTTTVGDWGGREPSTPRASPGQW